MPIFPTSYVFAAPPGVISPRFSASENNSD